MRIRFVGGPAVHAGPRFFRTVGVALAIVFALKSTPAAAFDWIPPRPVTAYLPSATLAPASTNVLQLVVIASGAPANVFWTASFSGPFPVNVTPSAGFLSIPAGGIQTVDFTVTLPDTADGSGFLTVELTHQFGGGRAAKTVGGVYAATLGRPEVKPVPGSWRAPAGTPGSMSYQVHSMIGSAEMVDLAVGRLNPDANNFGAIFAGSFTDTLRNLPAGGTITVTAPTTLASNAYAGSTNSIQLNVASAAGVSVAEGQAIVSASGSVPTALVPVGLVPFDASVAGRDGAASLPARAYRLIPSGLNGVRVMREVSIDSIGLVDTNGDGVDDRLLGTIRIPAYAAALAVIPGFVAASGDTFDLGLLAAGRAGLMLLDLRVLEDPPFGTWEDFFDVDGNGIDDRILRTIPLSGFATDVAWARAPSGRPVAFVADADTGSVPVSSAYNPALTVAGTGQGVVAIDVAAAVDSIGNPPFAAGTLPTPGSALDLEVRGGSATDLAIADGGSGVSVYRLSFDGGIPASVTYTPRGSHALSSAWGTPYARDIAWISNAGESTYVAVAASAGGVQILRVPTSIGMSLVLAQQTLAPAIGIAGAWTGTLGVAEGPGGVALMTSPGAGFLDRIAPAAGPPYTAPVVLGRGVPWAATGSALEVASHQSITGSASALCFDATSGPIPDLLVSDGARLLSLRPGTAPITAVEVEPTPPRPYRVTLRVTPNPMEGGGEFLVRSEWGAGGSSSGARVAAAGPALGPVRIEIYDVQGRLVRRLLDATHGAASILRLRWDGRDEQGRKLSSGRYWARATRLFGSGT
ncbi:MAG TPA: FlgD immunoglobulin-like domain containing protein, partial [Candidatus Eisenbacteria bacterium]|nr:FlgD immunoglobulin-like domain containing protein [Candidatus Eisenbacteria bacterium]